jgi:peptidoglycan/LPS O-acetylase OafA/YrhL
LQKQFYSQLEGLRGLAILLVMVSHFVIVPYFAKLHFLKLGFWGVNIFFVLSGFLITEILLKEVKRGNPRKTILKRFYVRRVLRIFPLYYLCILLLYIINAGNSGEVLLYTLTYTYNIANVWFNVDSEAVTHFWSLCVEEQFYLVWPLLLVFVNRKYYVHLILGMILTGLLSRIIYCGYQLENYRKFIMATPASFDCLGLGALLAYLKLNHSAFLERILKWYFVPVLAAFGLWIGLSLSDGAEDSFFYQAFGRSVTGVTGFYLVGIGALGFKTTFGKIMTGKLLGFIGKISYGLYVYHWLVFFFLQKKFTHWINAALKGDEFIIGKLKYNSYIFTFASFTIISVLVSFASYHLFEKRFLKLKEKVA